jgi:hypothetical protein
MDNTNVEVARLLPQDEVEIPPNRKEMRVKARPGTAFEIVFKCNEEGKSLIFTEGAGYKWVGCCPAGTKLMGNDTTAFDCGDVGEDVTGCKATNGYECCPSGYTWDGNDCTIIDDNHPCHPPPDCPMGQVRSIIDGMCIMACEPDMILNSEGFCVCPDGQVFDGVEDSNVSAPLEPRSLMMALVRQNVRMDQLQWPTANVAPSNADLVKFLSTAIVSHHASLQQF